MSLNTVTLKWDLTDLIEAGLSAVLSVTPTAQMSDATDHILIPAVARTYTFTGGAGQLAGIVANDNVNILPAGTGYLISVADASGRVIVAQFQTQILYANGATQWLDALAPVASVTTAYQYLPLPSGTPTAGQVPTATGSGEASAWATPAVSSVFGRTGAVVATSGDYAVGQVTGAAPLASPALTGTPTAPTAAPLTGGTQLATAGYADAAVGVEKGRAQAAEALLAPLASPALTGSPTAPTQTTGDNSTKIATDAFVTTAVATETTRATAAEALLAPKASPTFTGTVTVPTTVNPTDPAQKAYVDSVAAGLDAKPSVTALASANITLSGTQTIDGVAVTAGQRVLCTGQTTASQNGLWTVAAGAWTRPTDFASASTQLGAFVFVEGGTANGSSGWVLTGTAAVTVDTTAQTWTQFSGAGEINAGTNLVKSGNTLSLATSPALSGTPTAPTASALTNNTQLATTAYADSAVAVETTRAAAAEALRARLLTPTAVKTGAYSAAAGDYVPCDTTSGSFTVTLPNAPADLSVVGVKQVIQGGTNTITIACAGSDVFNKTGGGTTATLTLLAQGVLLQYKASSGIWYVFADDLPLTQLDSRYVAQSSLPLAIASGGTGQTTQQAALNALAGAQTAAQFLRGNGTNVQMSAIQAADLPAATTSVQGAVILDGTAADILAAGTRAAGANGKAADSGHVHPARFNDWLIYSGVAAANFDPRYTGSSFLTIAGTIYLMRLDVYQPLTITQVSFMCNSGSVGASSGNFVGIYNSSGTRIAVSSDFGTAFANPGPVFITVGSTSLTAGNYYYIAFVVNAATTQPRLYVSGMPASDINYSQAASVLQFAVNGTAQTSLPSSLTLGSSTNTGASGIWAGVQ